MIFILKWYKMLTCFIFQCGTQDSSVRVPCAAVIHFLYWLSNLITQLNQVFADIYHLAANTLEMQPKWTQWSTSDLCDSPSFEPAAWDTASTPLFSTVHIIICWSICALLGVHSLCCYGVSLLIGLCWSEPDSKSINCIPPASVLVDIKNVFWAQS